MDDNIGRLDATLPALTAFVYSYKKEDLLEREPLVLDKETKEAYLEHLRSIADKFPFLVVVGMRIYTEATIKEILRQKDIKFDERGELQEFITEIRQRGMINLQMADDLDVIRQLENIAAHGNKIKVETAQWALDVVPGILNEIKTTTL
ncbi:hypothetical protein MBAV_001792 [Candidatus Magnetobacterium bavaricum]|uniref:DUF4145 domain-containing protein n=1 Tax=Candidatus Magnetobacterium bavaricum TaxID=29290 RepID=A0A0F3GVM6_9BACT|nr:hypothetical protein MBAV_001792 [Candidatus Magnetobacterium bavaricum]